MADRNLNDDMVKLVEYTIVTVERDHECVLHRGQRMVTENMSGESFASWVIADWEGERRRPRPARSEAAIAGGFDDECQDGPSWRDPRQYLRVYYSVLERWTKQDLHYEERQLHALHGIQGAIMGKGSAGSSAST